MKSDSFNLAESLWDAMVEGLAPWQKTWDTGKSPGRACNYTSGREYRSGNALYLMAVAMKKGWGNQWITFVEARKMGGSLKGESGTRIEIPLVKTELDISTGQEVKKLRGFKSGVVFNIDQVSGVEFVGKARCNPIESVGAIERMLAELQSQGLTYIEPSENAGCWYLPESDTLGMPLRTAFDDTYEFYSSLSHEMGHSTMREGRVEREKQSYAYEELRAELAATLICSTLELPRTKAQVENHASYLKCWMDEFEDKKSMLLKAASEAQAIHDYLIDLSIES